MIIRGCMSTPNIKMEKSPSKAIAVLQPLKRCRICLVSKSEMLNIFDEEEPEPNRFFFKINQCAPIVIRNDDGFPHNICDDCILLLDNAYQFKLLCEQSDQILNTEITQNQNEIKCEPSVEFDDIYFETYQPDNDTVGDKMDTYKGVTGSGCDANADTVDTMDSDWSEGIPPDKEKQIKVCKSKTKQKYNNCPPKHQCDECGYLSLTVKEIAEHKKQCHLGILCHKCPECGKAFGKRPLMLRHIEMVHKIFPSACDLCEKTFKNTAQVSRHKKRAHFAEKKLKCEFCSNETMFCSKQQLETHMVSHTNEQKYSCDLCDKTFKTSSLRLVHRNKYHLLLKPHKVTQIAQNRSN